MYYPELQKQHFGLATFYESRDVNLVWISEDTNYSFSYGSLIYLASHLKNAY